MLAERSHRELIGAYTTAAVVNGSFFRPRDSVAVSDYMPSHQARAASAVAELSAEQLHQQSEFNYQVMLAAARMRREAATAAQR